ncbi:MAG: methionine synthase [Deltaproteobacteria bacterium]|jgi:5-methyltetrahydrofolate--homocysteine methyltransferase|nr:methionine synthase [Deltaproteobacteria bacterium]MBW2531006.1 methionine synthase [Deltaproteobacteria bacterium]
MNPRARLLQELLQSRVVCLDGGMGTELQAKALTAADFGGEAFEGCNENLVLTRPDVVESIHRAYLEAGADIIETDTFGATRLVLSEYPPLGDQTGEINRRAAEIARQVADELSTADRPRFVAGSMGPTTKPLSLSPGLSFAELRESYAQQARALIEGGVDYLLVETCQDTRNVKAALAAIEESIGRIGRDVAVAISCTIETSGTMLAGQPVEAFAVSLEHLDLLYLGLNCATGPDFMTDHLRALSELAYVPVACVPNAGMPDERGEYPETPETLGSRLERFVDQGWLNLVGGCCGTTPRHIRALWEHCHGRRPRVPHRFRRSRVSGLDVVEISDDTRPVLVGERTNVLGSRKFKRLIIEGKLEEASDIARRQVRSGAHIIDVCLQNPDRDEATDLAGFLEQAIRKVKVPLMIDSTDPAAIELALTYCQGKSIINSINLEDGLERFRQVVPLARRYGAALIVGCIDEDPDQGMAVSRERKLAIAQRSYDILTKDFGVPPTDLIFDPLTFPCATGDRAYLGSARETVEGLRLIKEQLPACKTVLGVSNVSFGLPPAGREVLNSVFLYHATKAGLDMAIVNSQKLERYAGIPAEERQLAEKVLFETDDEAVARFSDHFRGARARSRPEAGLELSLDERLVRCVVDGSKEGLIEDLDRKLGDTSPLDIINGPLLRGMQQVGRLFNDNKLIVAEVLQSAEVMKAAVSHLELHMDKDTAEHRGTVLLATVKGDVHDVGKNLVNIILSNNGYRVVDLGLKVPPQRLLEAVEAHQPDIIGLSGLLVKSAQQMVVTAQELTSHDVDVPLIVGGAALTRDFTRRRIAPEYGGLAVYAKDAMAGLDLAGRIMSPERRAELEVELALQQQALAESKPPPPPEVTSPPPPIERPVAVLDELPEPPDLARHSVEQLPIDEVWDYINPNMLYGRHLGLRGNPALLFRRGDPKAEALRELVDELMAEARPGGRDPMTVSAVWQFFRAESDGNAVRLYDALRPELVVAELEFRRQPHGEGLCLADYVAPANGTPRDSVCLFAVTAGGQVRERSERYREQGQYLRSHAIQALAVETAEAGAEWLHHKLRDEWGFPDGSDITLRDVFSARYRGRRYSFGFPACPELAHQVELFKLLRPEQIGMALTEEYMMDPEASVSALVLHHPAAKYFSIGRELL